MSKKSFVKGATILAVAGLIAKFIGAVFRIPLAAIIGTYGIGLYQMAYPIYAFLLVASTAGLPVAVSKMVSEQIALKNPREAHRVFKSAVILLTGLGIATSVILFSISGWLAPRLGNADCFYTIIAISPALFFVSILSAFRGYFQGMQIMFPTAISQITEQIGKLAIGLLIASAWLGRGAKYGAAGAILGVTISEAIALVILMLVYSIKRKDIMQNMQKSTDKMFYSSRKAIFKKMLVIAVPVTLGASIMPLVGLADSAMVVNRLRSTINIATGLFYTKEQATDLFGLLTGYANPLINFPAILTIALGMSLVPAISESFAIKDKRSIVQKTTIGIRLTLIIGLPAAAGMAILARPIILLLYPDTSAAQVIAAGQILSILSIGIVFLTLIQSLTAILQGVDKVSIPVRNLLIGAIFKIVTTFLLVSIPTFNVKGAAISTVLCYFIAAILDFGAVVKHTGVWISLMDMFIKPLLSAGLMGVSVYFVYNFIYSQTGSNSISLLFSIAVGIIIYVLLLILTGSIKEQDFTLLPGGSKIKKILQKLRLLR